jgi:hypothetical protein
MGQDCDADRINRSYGCSDKQANDVQVVNHQIQDDIDVQTPRRKQTHAMSFEEARPLHNLPQAHNGGVKSFQMSYLQ